MLFSMWIWEWRVSCGMCAHHLCVLYSYDVRRLWMHWPLGGGWGTVRPMAKPATTAGIIFILVELYYDCLCWCWPPLIPHIHIIVVVRIRMCASNTYVRVWKFRYPNIQHNTSNSYNTHIFLLICTYVFGTYISYRAQHIKYFMY